MLESASPLIFSIAVARDRHDSLLRDGIAPLLVELCASPSCDAAYFERVNKPEWGLRLTVLGASDWLETEVRPLVERRLASGGDEVVAVPDEPEDKWVGGARARQDLKRIYHADSQACLERLEAEHQNTPPETRAQWSLLLVERLVDLFALPPAERLELYRLGFQWEHDSGRWDDEVFGVLDRKYEAQASELARAIELRPDDAIASRLLDRVRAPIEALRAADAAGRLDRRLVELALLTLHAHSNRLGIHATQEATARYLVWRARGGGRGAAG